ncbi:hypothetical protein GCM10010232_07300 [Streptomyces amakusaensis]
MGSVCELAVNAYPIWSRAGWVYIWHAACTGMRPDKIYERQKTYTPPMWPACKHNPDVRAESLERPAGSGCLRFPLLSQLIKRLVSPAGQGP